jgi:hypothetical protein
MSNGINKSGYIIGLLTKGNAKKSKSLDKNGYGSKTQKISLTFYRAIYKIAQKTPCLGRVFLSRRAWASCSRRLAAPPSLIIDNGRYSNTTRSSNGRSLPLTFDN